MIIYGVALLAVCYLLGQSVGELLGQWLGIHANVGGVGFAMTLLILANQWLHKRRWLTSEMEQGILFWSNLYIPVIVAMSATQNVSAALTGGVLAVLAGVIPTALAISALPLLAKMARSTVNKTPEA